MKQSGRDDRTPDEKLAEELVDEALEGMAIPPSLFKAIRATMIGELLTTPEGRIQLRRAAPDPNVSSSAEVAKPGAPTKAAPQRAAGGLDLGGSKRKPRGGGNS